MATIIAKIDWPVEEEDDEGNEYFICPYCEGDGIACKGSTMDFGDDQTPMVVPIEPDWPCKICDETGQVRVGSEAHYFLIKNGILEVIENSFGKDIIDSQPEKDFKKFYTLFDETFRILKPHWLQKQ